jgi:hypothetical protein
MIRHMRFACRITKATDTYSEYVMPVAFARKQQWFRLYVQYTAVQYSTLQYSTVQYAACLFTSLDRLANELTCEVEVT